MINNHTYVYTIPTTQACIIIHTWLNETRLATLCRLSGLQVITDLKPQHTKPQNTPTSNLNTPTSKHTDLKPQHTDLKTHRPQTSTHWPQTSTHWLGHWARATSGPRTSNSVHPHVVYTIVVLLFICRSTLLLLLSFSVPLLLVFWSGWLSFHYLEY